MIEGFKQSGILISQNGTVEKWLQPSKIAGEKNEWFVGILHKIADVSTIPDDDVRKFMQEIRLYYEGHPTTT